MCHPGGIGNLLIIYIVYFLHCVNSVQIIENDPLPVPTLIRSHGYHTKTHEVLTKDGYILNLHRIPNPGKPPVLINHGLMGSSFTFVFLGPGKALAYKLYDAGFDVWLGNNRGNFYSHKHISLNSTQYQFWQFGIHEMGIYDLSAEIDYILDTTGKKKRDYVGFSLGAMYFWILMSERPQYNYKINQMHALAPMAYWGSKKTSSAFNKYLMASSMMVLRSLKIGEVLPITTSNRNFWSTVCSLNIFQGLCSALYLQVFANESKLVSQSLIPGMIKRHPAGNSLRTLEHAIQLIKTDKFSKYDFGPISNLKVYNTTYPPEYDLSNVLVPVYMQYVYRDTIALRENVEKLCKKIRNCKEFHMVPDLNFAHDDFIFGTSAPTLVYDHIIKILKSYYKDLQNNSNDLELNTCSKANNILT